jgi:hypothetical protein
MFRSVAARALTKRATAAISVSAVAVTGRISAAPACVRFASTSHTTTTPPPPGATTPVASAEEVARTKQQLEVSDADLHLGDDMPPLLQYNEPLVDSALALVEFVNSDACAGQPRLEAAVAELVGVLFDENFVPVVEQFAAVRRLLALPEVRASPLLRNAAHRILASLLPAPLTALLVRIDSARDNTVGAGDATTGTVASWMSRLRSMATGKAAATADTSAEPELTSTTSGSATNADGTPKATLDPASLSGGDGGAVLILTEEQVQALEHLVVLILEGAEDDAAFAPALQAIESRLGGGIYQLTEYILVLQNMADLLLQSRLSHLLVEACLAFDPERTGRIKLAELKDSLEKIMPAEAVAKLMAGVEAEADGTVYYPQMTQILLRGKDVPAASL